MMDMWMDVDTALAEVPVNLMPLIDDTDFKTRETAVAYNAAGMDLVWNFVTTAGAMTQTAVTPTTAGTYDWTHQGDGIYSIEIPASGGASINNDTEGFGWFSGIATGVLPWRGPVIGFRAAALNDALIDSAWSTTRGLAGTALPNAAADAAGGLIISDAGGLDADAQRSDVAAILVDTGTTLQAELDGIQADTEDIQARLPAALVSGRMDSSVGAMAANVMTAAAAAADLTTEIQSGLATAASIAALNNLSAAQVNTEVDTALADIHLDHLLAVTYDPASKPGAADALLNELVESDAGVARFTANALEQAPTGAGGDGSAFTAIPWNAAWDAEVQSKVQDAIEANHLDHLLAVDYDPASKPGSATALLNEIIGSDAGVSQFTANALELAPSGTGASAASIRAEMDANSTQLAKLGTPAGASISADIAAVKAQTAAIETDTTEIGVAGAGLTNINLPNQTMDIVGNITGNLSGSVGSLTGLTASDIAAIKAKTDSLAFTVAGQVDANVQYVNDVQVSGTGSLGDEWGPV